jgi:hypothetical protein
MTRAATLAHRRAFPLVSFCAVFGACTLATLQASAATTGSGYAANETWAVSGFRAAALRGGIDVVLRLGNTESV